MCVPPRKRQVSAGHHSRCLECPSQQRPVGTAARQPHGGGGGRQPKGTHCGCLCKSCPFISRRRHASEACSLCRRPTDWCAAVGAGCASCTAASRPCARCWSCPPNKLYSYTTSSLGLNVSMYMFSFLCMRRTCDRRLSLRADL